MAAAIRAPVTSVVIRIIPIGVVLIFLGAALETDAAEADWAGAAGMIGAGAGAWIGAAAAGRAEAGEELAAGTVLGLRLNNERCFLVVLRSACFSS